MTGRVGVHTAMRSSWACKRSLARLVLLVVVVWVWVGYGYGTCSGVYAYIEAANCEQSWIDGHSSRLLKHSVLCVMDVCITSDYSHNTGDKEDKPEDTGPAVKPQGRLGVVLDLCSFVCKAEPGSYTAAATTTAHVHLYTNITGIHQDCQLPAHYAYTLHIGCRLEECGGQLCRC